MSESPIEMAIEKAKAEKEAPLRTAILADTVKHWNSFVRGLLSAVTAWERYRMNRLDNAVQIEEFPLELQRMFMLANPHGDLDIIIEDIVTVPRLEEHLKTLFISVKKED